MKGAAVTPAAVSWKFPDCTLWLVGIVVISSAPAIASVCEQTEWMVAGGKRSSYAAVRRVLVLLRCTGMSASASVAVTPAGAPTTAAVCIAWICPC